MKLGFAIHDLGPSQLAYKLIRNSNEYLESHPGDSVIGFYQEMIRPIMNVGFPIMQIHEAFGFDGCMVGTSLSTMNKVISCASPLTKIFYVWDLEWLRMQQCHYEKLANIYRNPDITLIVRSEDHSQAISDVFNVKPSHIIDDFDIEKIMSIAEELENAQYN